MEKHDMNDICERCGEVYGEHIYNLQHDEAQCLTGYGIFKLKEQINKLEKEK